MACVYTVEEAYRGDEPSVTVPAAFLADARLVVEKWNAEHPEDDDEPVTQEWLNRTWPLPEQLRYLSLSDMGGGEWSIWHRPEDTADWDSAKVRNVATRGDVRAFLRGMGMTIGGAK